MTKKFLLEKTKDKYTTKNIRIFENPEQFSPITSKLAWTILTKINKKPYYTKDLARELRIHEQKLYYHIHRLKNAGFIKEISEEKKRGGSCKFFAITDKAFGIELPSEKEESIKVEKEEYTKIKEFFHDFIEDGVFNGSIVVGSPTPHGPYLTTARDGHCAVQVAMFIGNFCDLPKRFIVKLDTELKAEHEEKRNMILIGGPITNIISEEINEKAKIRFKWKNGWRIYSEISKKEYSDEDLAIISKIQNPWDKTKAIIQLAGLKFESTKSSTIAITQYFEKILRDYTKQENFSCLIRGLDKDGDGKVDNIEIIEKTH